MEVDITLVSVLVIILFFIPGFFFKRFYFTGQFTKQFGAGVFAERFITSVFWGIVIQSISFFITCRVVDIPYNSIGSFSKFYTQLCNNEIPNVTINLRHVGLYILFTILLAVLLGTVCHKIVRLLRIDIYLPAFRFANYWNYYFKGDLLPLRGGRRGKVLSTDVDVIADIGDGGTRLYSGFLSDYTISQTTGELETIALTGVQKRDNGANQFLPISGDCLIIPYNKILNFNIRYNVTVTARRAWIAVISRIAAIVALIVFLSIFFVIPYKFFHELGLWLTILAVVLAIIDWVLIASIIAMIFTKPTNSTASKRELITTRIFAALILGGICWYLTSTIIAILY